MTGSKSAMATVSTTLARISVVALASVAATVGATNTAHAGTGLNLYDWGAPGVTISSSSNSSSNMAGFIQALINSLGDLCTVANNGIYDSTTTWWAAVLENAMLNNYNSGGVMTPYWLHALWAANVPGYPDRALSDLGIYDGYGTDYHTYYSGGGALAALGWNGFAKQWLFAQNPNYRSSLVQATPTWTIGSVCF